MFMMSTQILGAVYLVLSSVMILMGLLSEFTSYKLAGAVISVLGYCVFELFGWERAVNMRVLRDRVNRGRLTSKEMKELVIIVVVLIGSTMFTMGTVSIAISNIMGINNTTSATASFVWAGVAGCLVTLIAGVVNLVDARD